MQKIRVNFHMGRLLGGGVETSLLTYLRLFDRELFDVSLTVGWQMEELDKFTNLVPEDVVIRYLVSSERLNKYKVKKIRAGKLNLFEKIIENIVLVPLGRLKYTNAFKNNLKYYDIVFDYGLSLPKECLHVNVPVIGFLHFNLTTYLSSKLGNFSRMRYKFSKYSGVVVLNDIMLSDCQKAYPELKSKFYKIYNLFNTEKILQLSGELIEQTISSYIVTVGRLEESTKDFSSLLEAFYKLKKEYAYNGMLVVVGDGHSRDYLEERVSSLGLSDYVLFVGAQANPFKYMKNADVFAFSSKFEGFGNVIVEAMIVGVPIVATDCPVGPSEILQNGASGVLVKVGNVDELAYNINNVLTNQTLRAELLRNASIRVNDFSASANLIQLYKLIWQQLNYNFGNDSHE